MARLRTLAHDAWGAIAALLILALSGLAVIVLFVGGYAAVIFVVEAAVRGAGDLVRTLGVEDVAWAIALVAFGAAMGLLGGYMVASAAGLLQGTRLRRADLAPAMRIAGGAVGVAFLWVGVLAMIVGLGGQPPQPSVTAGFQLFLALLGIACIGVGLDRARGHLAARRYPSVLIWGGALAIGALMVAAALVPELLR